MGSKEGDHPILPEAEKLSALRALCIYGEDDQESLCRNLSSGIMRVEALPGGHHFDGAYEEVATRILDVAR
jgi:type IV secretory pathway VirJ component